jgi:hypothetical protein
MNTKKLILGLSMGFAFLAMSCTQNTAQEDGLYENGVDKTQLINGDKKSVDKTQLINGDKRN